MFIAAGHMTQDRFSTVTAFPGFIEYAGRIAVALGIHITHVFFPVHLFPRYLSPFTLGSFYGLCGVAVTLLFTAGLLTSLVYKRRAIALFLLFAGVLYAPVSNLIPLVRFTADSYFYAPLIGLIALPCIALETSFTRFTRWKSLLIGAFVILAMALAGLSIHQQLAWKSATALWRPLYETFPDNPHAIDGYASAVDFDGDEDAAYNLYNTHEKDFMADGWLSTQWITLLSIRGETQRAKAAYLWAFDNMPTVDLRLKNNFVVLLIRYPSARDQRSLAIARKLLPDYFADLRVKHARPGSYIEAAELAVAAGSLEIAEQFAREAFSLSRERRHFDLGAMLCKKQKRTDCDRRWRIRQ